MLFRVLTRGLCAAAICCLLAANVQAAVPPAAANDVASAGIAPELPVPPEVRSVHGVALLRLTAAIDPKTKLPAFVYAGKTVPPTIRVRPGDTIVIDYTNALPAETMPPLDMTNLHTHGLMDSPKAPGDQVIMTMVMPGQTYRYVFNIPRNQPPGLYWYHPHPHGESNRQVASGMSGLIVIDGIDAYAPVVRGLAERDIILRDYYFDPANAPLARLRRAQRLRRDLAAGINPADEGPDCRYKDASKGITINGVHKAVITMAPGTRQFFRVANASANSAFDLEIPGSKLLVVANDGVPLSFHDRSIQGQWVDHVFVPPAGRTEFVVSAPATSGVPLETECVDYGPAGDVGPERTFATLQLGTEPNVPHLNGASFASAEPFGDIHAAPVVAHRLVAFSEDNADSLFFINGQLWDPDAPPMFTVKAGTVEEWTVLNYADEIHVFHIHQIHFLVEDVNGKRQPKSTWRDTLTIPYATRAHGSVRPGVAHLLMDFRDPLIAGTFVFHCHILEHEDYGMMAKIRVLSTAAAAPLNASNFRPGFISPK